MTESTGSCPGMRELLGLMVYILIMVLFRGLYSFVRTQN